MSYRFCLLLVNIFCRKRLYVACFTGQCFYLDILMEKMKQTIGQTSSEKSAYN